MAIAQNFAACVVVVVSRAAAAWFRWTKTPLRINVIVIAVFHGCLAECEALEPNNIYVYRIGFVGILY